MTGKSRSAAVAWALAACAVVLVLLVVAGGGAWWALRSDGGAVWILARVPGLVTEGGRGTLWGDYAAARIEFALPGGGRVVLTDAGWRGLHAEHAPWVAWKARLVMGGLRARRIELVLPAGEKNAPAPPPATLRLPVELEIGELHVGELHAAALGGEPLRDLRAHVHLGDLHGMLHRVEAVALAWNRTQATGAAAIAADPPFTLRLEVHATQPPAGHVPAWQAHATLDGPLAEPVLVAGARAEPAAALDLRTVLRPFDPWPLGELALRMQSIDASAFADGAPVTSLSGSARVETRGMTRPAVLSMNVDNAAPGRWNDGRLPLRRLEIDLRARPDDPRTLDLRQLSAELGTHDAPGGRIEGHGHWTPGRWMLDATLDALRPSLLDARAPALTLSGPLSATGDGFDRGLEQATLALQARLAGRLADRGPARAAQLSLDATASWLRVDVRQAHAMAGSTRATLAGTAMRAAADRPWRLRGRGTLAGFDPAAWWPGPVQSAWRHGPHRLDGDADVDVVWSGAPRGASLAGALGTLRGDARLALRHSVLAGVPLAGIASLRTGADGVTTTLKLDAAGNTIEGSGRFATGPRGAGDRWTVAVAAPSLARLAPLWRMVVPGDTALSGAVSGEASVEGRWPDVATHGRIEATDVAAGTTRVQRVQARWRMDARADDAAIDVQATLARIDASAALGNSLPPIDAGELQVAGTLRAHTIALKAQSRALPPAWVAAVQPAAAGGERSIVAIDAHGGALHAATRHATVPWIGWRGRVQRIELHGAHADASPWLRTRDVEVEVQWAEGPPRVVVQPGRAELLGGALRWNHVAWRAAAPQQRAQLDADIELEPYGVAPLLARLQPAFGWAGDLAVAGRAQVHTTPSIGASILLERTGGDLRATDETGATQALGLTDLRVALDARDGVWRLTVALAGRALGAAAGTVAARTPRDAAWPTSDTPLEGVLELQVANLGTWGSWVPAGWRLSGSLRTGLAVGGRVGAPEYTGTLTGSGIGVRNLLLGVDVREGDVAVALRGTGAHIERFGARAGDGTVRLDGDATFGAAPQATLVLQADRFQVLGRIDRRIVASGRATLHLDRDTLALEGRFGIDEGLIDFTRSEAPRLPDDFVVVRRTRAQAPAAASRPAATTERAVRLDLALSLGQRLRLRGRGLDTGLQGDLHITAPNGKVNLGGTVRAVGGTYQAYGQKLVIDRGTVMFSGAVENPRLEIEATRPNLDVRVGVEVTGTALDPRVRLFSEPEMTEMEKLSWLVLGRARDPSGSDDTALLQRAAMALLAGESGAGSGQALGLDQVSFRKSEGDVHDTVVSLGKQLSQRWYVGYERSLDATTGSWQLIYRVAQRFTLRAQAGAESTVDVIWTWRWQ
jgi:translocation and assembly module TamB